MERTNNQKKKKLQNLFYRSSPKQNKTFQRLRTPPGISTPYSLFILHLSLSVHQKELKNSNHSYNLKETRVKTQRGEVDETERVTIPEVT
ncbi:hypothetical protein CEXT_604771 [Caerostris extrusa]|uniref:Uncharacterized protein n=1 Tax=Caerostris extrusa TaxID=172846 RepID=A0AAV4TZR7_CAEEX|nr:hypothetical protein CEXT_604771 [Caerostris extrusa]